MNKYFVTLGDDMYDNEIEVIDAADSKAAAILFIENHYMHDEYGEVVKVYEPKVNHSSYVIDEPEITVSKLRESK